MLFWERKIQLSSCYAGCVQSPRRAEGLNDLDVAVHWDQEILLEAVFRDALTCTSVGDDRAGSSRRPNTNRICSEV